MLQSPLPCDGQFILFLLHPHVFNLLGQKWWLHSQEKVYIIICWSLTSEEV
jgi:hypothetical protein